jgi:hypothetical protein
MPFLILRLRAAACGLSLCLGAAAASACSDAGLQGLYLWPMTVSSATHSCQVSVHLMFDGQGRGWMQPVDASCPRPGLSGQAGASVSAPVNVPVSATRSGTASAFRYSVDEECSGHLTDAHGRYQLELEREDVELTLDSAGLRISGVATRQRDLMPGELALINRKPRLPARPARSEAR